MPWKLNFPQSRLGDESHRSFIYPIFKCNQLSSWKSALCNRKPLFLNVFLNVCRELWLCSVRGEHWQQFFKRNLSPTFLTEGEHALICRILNQLRKVKILPCKLISCRPATPSAATTEYITSLAVGLCAGVCQLSFKIFRCKSLVHSIILN